MNERERRIVFSGSKRVETRKKKLQSVQQEQNMNKFFVRDHATTVSVLLFLAVYLVINLWKPRCFFNTDGSLREFGVGYTNRTILPLWLFSIVLGILSYLAIVYYVHLA